MLDPAPWPIARGLVPRALRRDRGAARRAARRHAHRAHQSLAAALRPGAAAARSALLDLVRHDAHRRLGPALSRARVVVSGHLHLRTTLWRHGVRYEEVSLGYPRDWRAERGIEWYLRDILPGTSTACVALRAAA